MICQMFFIMFILSGVYLKFIYQSFAKVLPIFAVAAAKIMQKK